jgi:hypothetical protein
MLADGVVQKGRETQKIPVSKEQKRRKRGEEKRRKEKRREEKTSEGMKSTFGYVIQSYCKLVFEKRLEILTQ